MGSGGADGLAVKVEPAQAPRAVPDGVVAVEMAAHEHAEAGTGAAAGLFRQLERDETGGDDVIAGDDTLVLDAQACARPSGRGRCTGPWAGRSA